MVDQKRVGLVGLSAKGSWAVAAHLPYLQQSSHYKITALQNSSKASADEAAKQYSLDGVTTHGNPSSLASDPNVDIVAVSVNVPEHYGLIIPALEAGKDVFSEWPLARNLADAEKMVQLAKEKGVRTMVGLQARQSPSILKAKEIVSSGKLGRILSTTLYGHGGLFGPTIVEKLEYLLPIESGANLVTIPFGHTVDAFCHVLGEIKDLSATLVNLRPELQVTDSEGKPLRTVAKSAHDYVSISGFLVNGGGVVDVTYAPGYSRTNRDFYWEIIGTEGTLILDGEGLGGAMAGNIQTFQPTVKFVKEDHAFRSMGSAVAQKEPEVIYPGKTGELDFSVGKAWEAWAGAGLDEGYSVTTFEDALVRHRMIDAIYRSAKQGTKENYV
ncbi:NAD-binding Rossmann fold oxidoreductase family protein [Dothidotthia symphoricarpi CBS 119687]|uniref:NAD-binding Rossmann fold oxidoreductase family protein n=1 Tax=Dothidotthia symphoricarpi CBS 119687 TaxID=1392245 RepID=A0A6A5ZWM0_9PLEO|nr:NAD-binding Rossmann fold oxidoreductase family protein [Dothidotthia symphoricarpi CBS 119687]KAF2123293.1 NAD-binding Rossmann fold oxidoreductase family protein [Dothidotthia symphoricarpi CBS 119687]